MRLLVLLLALLPACAHNHERLEAVQASCAQAATTSGELRAALDSLRADYAQLRANYDKLMAMIEQPAPEPERVAEEGPQRRDVPIEGAPFIGAADAKVVIVEFSDFQCPFCSRVQGTLERVRETWPKDVKIVFRHLPLPFHPDAMPAAKAAEAAGRQGKFWEMHDLLFENQRELESAHLEGYAKKLQLNMKRFKSDMADKAIEARIQSDMELADKVGARGTPMFFVNGWMISGAQPFEAFKARIESELAALKK